MILTRNLQSSVDRLMILVLLGTTIRLLQLQLRQLHYFIYIFLQDVFYPPY